MRDAVQRIRSDLPGDLKDPVITKSNLAGTPILTYTVASTRMDEEALSWFVDHDVAKAMLDYGLHPPTMYFPLIVHEALMFEPTETESRQTLDDAAKVYAKIWKDAHETPESLHNAPARAQVGRPDEVAAARSPRLRYEF